MTTRPEDEQAVLAAQTEFYAAFMALDVRRMGRVWAQRDSDVCIHPGWEILTGWPVIRESWRAIFANTGFMKFHATEIQVEVFGDAARATCVENLLSVAGTQTVHSKIAATNLFVRQDDGWKLVLHHGSPMAMHHNVEELDVEEPAN